MSDDPGAGAASLVSLWQTGARALRAERWFGFEALSDDAAVLLSGVAWGEPESP